jgi:hypothetical protein
MVEEDLKKRDGSRGKPSSTYQFRSRESSTTDSSIVAFPQSSSKTITSILLRRKNRERKNS